MLSLWMSIQYVVYDIENYENKKLNSKLMKRECKFCKCQDYNKSNCGGEDKRTKLVIKDLVVPLQEGKANKWHEPSLKALPIK